MTKLVTIVGGAAVGACGFFLISLLSTLGGALAGWIVGLFFADTMLGIAGQLGIRGIEMWQLGAFLGFTSGFFRARVST